jgi:hypothetical protein
VYANINNPSGTSTKSAATRLKILKELPLYSLLQKDLIPSFI